MIDNKLRQILNDNLSKQLAVQAIENVAKTDAVLELYQETKVAA